MLRNCLYWKVPVIKSWICFFGFVIRSESDVGMVKIVEFGYRQRDMASKKAVEYFERHS